MCLCQNNVVARSATWEKAHDQAFTKAMEELKPDFIQCPRCSPWVCRKSCWNENKGLCKNCAPDLGVEMAAAQANRTVEEIWAHSKMAEADREMLQEKSWREGVWATCRSCNAPLAAKAKFCPECGARIEGEARCTECGAKLGPGVKFCAECGARVEQEQLRTSPAVACERGGKREQEKDCDADM